MDEKWIIAYHYFDEIKNKFCRTFLEFHFEDNAIEKYKELQTRDDIIKLYLTKTVNYIN